MPYFDHNATAPLSAPAREAWLRATDEAWQNPSSLYRDAARVKIRLTSARERFAQFLACPPDRVIFNSGATEGANDVFRHWARDGAPAGNVAISPTEHPCVVEAAKQYMGARLVWLETSVEGVVQLDALERLMSSEPLSGVAVMAANNETGIIQPWLKIAQACRKRGVPYFCDATQWVGKLPVSRLGEVDWVTGSAHKFGGPKGVGFLKRGSQAQGFRGQRGGDQENAHRGGTENFPGISAMLAGLAEAEEKKVFLETQRLTWRDTFEREIEARVPGTVILAKSAERLWNTVSLLMPHAENQRWVTRLDKAGFQVSTGSACATGKAGPSHVLAAMGLDPLAAKRVVRVSSGWDTTPDDWQALAIAFEKVAVELQAGASQVIKP
jgi:cysteine desulfurase